MIEDHPAVLFSDDRRFRFRLTRRVGFFSDRSVMFVMLNPSTADEERDDATIRRLSRVRQQVGIRLASRL